MSFTYSSSSSFKKPTNSQTTTTTNKSKDPNVQSGKHTSSGFTSQGILKFVENQIKPKKNAFKKWATIRKTLKTKNQTNILEALKKAEEEFIKLDPEKGPSIVKKIKTQYPTTINKEEQERIKKEKQEKMKRRIISRNIKIQQAIQEGRPLSYPPLSRKPILTNAQKQTLRNKGIVGLKKGGTRKR